MVSLGRALVRRAGDLGLLSHPPLCTDTLGRVLSQGNCLRHACRSVCAGACPQLLGLPLDGNSLYVGTHALSSWERSKVSEDLTEPSWLSPRTECSGKWFSCEFDNRHVVE